MLRIIVSGTRLQSPATTVLDRQALPVGLTGAEYAGLQWRNEKPRRNPKMPDGVFHAVTSRKVAALKMKTPDPRLRSGRLNILLRATRCRFPNREQCSGLSAVPREIAQVQNEGRLNPLHALPRVVA